VPIIFLDPTTEKRQSGICPSPINTMLACKGDGSDLVALTASSVGEIQNDFDVVALCDRVSCYFN